jgi:hypothetical protein
VRLAGVSFELGRSVDPSARSALVLSSRLTRGEGLPVEATVELDAKARTLVVLHTMNLPCRPGAKVGTYRLTYDNGQSAEVELVYGRNVLACTDTVPAAEAPIVWSGSNRAGQAVALRALVWKNPYPEQMICSFTAVSSEAAGSLILMGLTGLQGAADGA